MLVYRGLYFCFVGLVLLFPCAVGAILLVFFPGCHDISVKTAMEKGALNPLVHRNFFKGLGLMYPENLAKHPLAWLN